MLRSTIDNHRDSRLHLLITLSYKRRIQLFATLGYEVFCHDGEMNSLFATLCDELFATLDQKGQSPGEIKPPNLKTI